MVNSYGNQRTARLGAQTRKDRDANLTSQVLRIANSVRFNPLGSPLTTVSRAIVLVGFQGIRDICLSIAIIDTLLDKEPKEHLLAVMAKGFHSGSQARWMMPEGQHEVREQVFVAGLLQRLGEMAAEGMHRGIGLERVAVAAILPTISLRAFSTLHRKLR